MAASDMTHWCTAFIWSDEIDLSNVGMLGNADITGEKITVWKENWSFDHVSGESAADCEKI